MTAPTEPLKLTPAELEEAAAAVEDLYRWNEVPTPPLVGKLRRLAQGAAEDAEPAAARDDAAELRAAVKAYFEAVHEYELFRVQEGDGPYPVSDEGDRFVELSHDLADAELHLKTLAATEGSA